MAGRHCDIDRLDASQFFRFRASDHINVVRVRGRDEESGGPLRLVFALFFLLALPPDHIGWMLTYSNCAELFSVVGPMMIDGAVHPAGDKIRFAVGMKQYPVGPSPGRELFNHTPGLQIDDV